MNLRKLLGLCEHKWKIHKWSYIIDEYGKKVGIYYNLQCEKCGYIKIKRLCPTTKTK